MAITIDDPEVERLARALAAERGVSVEQAIEAALRERAGDTRGHDRAARAPATAAPVEDRAAVETRGQAMRAVLDRWYAELRTLPVRDTRTLEEMLYDDEYGLPK